MQNRILGYLNIHAKSLYVRGANRAIVCDISRGDFKLVPNSLVDFVGVAKDRKIGDLYDQFPEDHQTVNEYIEFLLENDLAVISNDPSLHFPPISLEWDFPAIIANVIIESNNKIEISKELSAQLTELLVKHIQLRIYSVVSLFDIRACLEILNNVGLHSLEIVLKYSEYFTSEIFKEFLYDFTFVKSIIVHSSPHSLEVYESNGFSNVGVVFLKQEISSHLCCGIISHSFFAVNIPHFTESQHHNTCLNRKISIDAEGNIKNRPSMSEGFGNIKDTTLKEVIEKPGFKKYWNITKDQIAVCKDCEFRHICTDCRAYLEIPDDIYSKPLKCGYNPYTCEWEEWSTHPLKQQAIEFYGMGNLVKSN